MKLNLCDYSLQGIAELFANLGEKPYRSLQLVKWVHQLGKRDFLEMSNFSLALRQQLHESYEVQVPELVSEKISIDGTRKWLLKLVDGSLIETVYIPEKLRGTLCISSQVGCPIGCSFCATGGLGFRRNLSLAEIIGQLWLAVRKLSPDGTTRSHVVTNVVFMGMGEPLLNYSNVLYAVQLMLDANAYGLSKSRVTISTCGILPAMQALQRDTEVALALSLHATTDELRNKLVPINTKYALSELIAFCDNYFLKTGRAVTIEYIMLDQVNDSSQDAKRLVKLLSHGRYKVNLIPGNSTNGQFQPSSEVRLEAFRNLLLAHGLNTITRKSRGSDIMAACGQLVAAEQKGREI